MSNELRKSERLYLAHYVLNLLEELEIEVRILNDEDFEAELSEDPNYAKIPKKLAKKFRLAKNTCGSSRKEIPSVNIDCILRDIHKFEAEEDLGLTIEEKILIVFSTALHEYSESKLSYTDCESAGCPMNKFLKIRRSGSSIIIPLDPCSDHSDLWKIITKNPIQKLLK